MKRSALCSSLDTKAYFFTKFILIEVKLVFEAKSTVWLTAMEVKLRYPTHEIMKSFGSAGKVETIHVSRDAKYEDLLNTFREKLSG